MNNFNEQVVRRVNKPKNLIIKIVSVLLLILVPTTLFLLAFATIAYLIYVAFFCVYRRNLCCLVCVQYSEGRF